MESSEHKEGYQAFQSGKRFNENPYSSSRQFDQWVMWSDGWADAEEDEAS